MVLLTPPVIGPAPAARTLNRKPNTLLTSRTVLRSIAADPVETGRTSTPPPVVPVPLFSIVVSSICIRPAVLGWNSTP